MSNAKSITELARELRKNPTPSEKIFWESVRKRRLNGLRFLRQFPIVHEERDNQKYFYIADFYCAEHNLGVEIDGEIHEFTKRHDYNRDVVLKRMGFKVLRIRNEELVDMKKVHNRILEAIN